MVHERFNLDSGEPDTPAEVSAGCPRRRSSLRSATQRAAVIVLAALTASACTTDVDLGGGVRQHGNHLFTYEGPEMEAVLATHQVAGQLGDSWLVLALELQSSPGAGAATVRRSDISVRRPDGRPLPLIEQAEYRKNYGRVRVAVERALAALPTIGRFDSAQMPCDRWFLADPLAGFAYDEIAVNTFQTCRGPLVFHVPGGIQPGRWRLLVELEESTVDIPFEVEEPG